MFVYQKSFLTNQLNQIILKLLSQVKICFVIIIFYILRGSICIYYKQHPPGVWCDNVYVLSHIMWLKLISELQINFTNQLKINIALQIQLCPTSDGFKIYCQQLILKLANMDVSSTFCSALTSRFNTRNSDCLCRNKTSKVGK